MILHHAIQLILDHPPRINHIIPLLFLLQIPQLYLLSIILSSLLHLLRPYLCLSPLLLRPKTLIYSLKFHASLPALQKLLGLPILILLLLHLVIFEHALVHEHVHVSL